MSKSMYARYFRIGRKGYIERLWITTQRALVPPPQLAMYQRPDEFLFTYAGSNQEDIGRLWGLSQQQVGRYIENFRKLKKKDISGEE